MDSRLQRVGGGRLTHLRRSDAPKVAQAMVDALYGRARVLSGISKDTAYVEFVRDNSYAVVVRGDDWKKIFPFLRYSVSGFQPVIPPGNPPDPILSPQPNRVMPPPPESPTGAMTSFLDGLPFDEYSKIQKLLSITSVNTLDPPSPPARQTIPAGSPSDVLPPIRRQNSLNFREDFLFNNLVQLLQQLFPVDYPTKF